MSYTLIFQLVQSNIYFWYSQWFKIMKFSPNLPIYYSQLLFKFLKVDTPLLFLQSLQLQIELPEFLQIFFEFLYVTVEHLHLWKVQKSLFHFLKLKCRCCDQNDAYWVSLFNFPRYSLEAGGIQVQRKSWHTN